MTNEELQKIEEELKEKRKRINELMEIRSELLEIPEVKKFSETDEEYRKKWKLSNSLITDCAGTIIQVVL